MAKKTKKKAKRAGARVKARRVTPLERVRARVKAMREQGKARIKAVRAQGKAQVEKTKKRMSVRAERSVNIQRRRDATVLGRLEKRLAKAAARGAALRGDVHEMRKALREERKGARGVMRDERKAHRAEMRQATSRLKRATKIARSLVDESK